MLCRAGLDHQQLKLDDAAWALLDYVGVLRLDPEDAPLELRNCPCGSTIAREVADGVFTAPGPSIESAARAACEERAL